MHSSECIHHSLAPLHRSYEEYINSNFLALTSFLHITFLYSFLETTSSTTHGSILSFFSNHFQTKQRVSTCAVTKIVLRIGLWEPLLRSLSKNKVTYETMARSAWNSMLHTTQSTTFDWRGSSVSMRAKHATSKEQSIVHMSASASEDTYKNVSTLLCLSSFYHI